MDDGSFQTLIAGAIQGTAAAAYAIVTIRSLVNSKGSIWNWEASKFGIAVGLVLQCFLLGLLAFDLARIPEIVSEKEHIRLTSRDVLALVGILFSILNIVLGKNRTIRGLYHLLCSIIWISAVGSDYAMVSVAFVLAFILDLTAPWRLARFDVGQVKQTNLLGRCAFAQLDQLLSAMERRGLKKDMLAEVDHQWSVDTALKSNMEWIRRAGSGNPTVWHVFTTWSKVQLVGLTGLFMVLFASQTAEPFALQRLLDQSSSRNAMLFFAVMASKSIALVQLKGHLRYLGTITKTRLTLEVWEATLKRSTSLKSTAIEPSVITEMDISRVYDFIAESVDVWNLPLQFLVGIGILMDLIGSKATLIGLAAMLLLVPSLSYVASSMGEAIGKSMSAKNARVQLVKEVLDRIRAIKLYGWEEVFEEKIHSARKHDIDMTNTIALSNGMFSAITTLMPSVFAAVSFGIALLFGNPPTQSVIFPALTVFGMISEALVRGPGIMMLYFAATNSFSRVVEYLQFDETDIPAPRRDQFMTRAPKISVESASFSWNSAQIDNSSPILVDVSLQIQGSQLVAVTGAVGTGKSSLLSAIYGSLFPLHGKVLISGQIGYMPQTAFLINDTVRNNILFGQEFDGQRYSMVVEACCLGKDFDSLEHGDGTFLRGAEVTLSGGQKSRIALARTLYVSKEIYLLDDPLAAIDKEVQRAIVSHLFGKDGLLSNSICIITGNSEILVRSANTVWNIADKTVYITSASDVIATEDMILDEGISDSAATQPLPTPTKPRESQPSESQPTELATISEASVVLKTPVPITTISADESTIITLPNAASNQSQGDIESLGGDEYSAIQEKNIQGYSDYVRILQLAKPGGWFITITTISLTVLSAMASVYWLKVLSESSGKSAITSIIWFFGFGLIQSLLTFFAVMAAFQMCLLPMMLKVHNLATCAVMRTKFSFFDVTPLGQIINRFTNDMNRVDGSLAGNLIHLAISLIGSVLSIGFLVIASPLSLPYILPMGLLYLKVQSHFISGYSQVRRIEAGTRTSILNSLQEVVSGGQVMAAMNQVEYFRSRNRKYLDETLRAWVPFATLDLWLTMRLELMGGVLALLSAILFVQMNMTAGMMGLLMTYIIRVVGSLSTLVTYRTALEADMVSVDRIFEFVSNEAEGSSSDNTSTAPLKPLASWPENGSIIFNEYSGRYRSSAPLTLRNLSFSIDGGEKIAVIGRTGAGKTSFALALIRAFESESGSIIIDGLNISTVDIRELRSRFAMIPQRAVLFTGSLRENLDPAHKHDDSEISQVVRQCGLEKILASRARYQTPYDDVLDFQFVDGGESYSAGELQLISIARAMVSPAKILVLDEATASLDPETSAIIHSALSQSFVGRTVISITHRLDTIFEYDRVLTLEAGEVAEFDTPVNLLNHVGGSVLKDLMGEVDRD